MFSKKMPIQNLCAGNFMNEMIVPPLVRLLDDPSTSVQVSACLSLNIMFPCQLSTTKSHIVPERFT